MLCAPVAASVAAAWAVHGQLPAVRGPVDRLWQLLVLGLVSTVVVVLVDRLARRLLPLVTLLDLSMLFPDQAPSRLAVARDAIRRRPIEEQLARVRDAGADPGAVAREILTLVAALSAHDRPTRGHAERVRMFTDLLAEQLKVPRRDRDLLRWAAILHDIGKLQVPADPAEQAGQAHRARSGSSSRRTRPTAPRWPPGCCRGSASGRDVIVEHHERYDGTGYPTGLCGAGISLGARIVSVADAFDVMTAARAYKRPVSRAAALRELVRFSGTQFDPTVVRAMVAVGAPRLRRTQGLLAWLADLPLVASAVPGRDGRAGGRGERSGDRRGGLRAGRPARAADGTCRRSGRCSPPPRARTPARPPTTRPGSAGSRPRARCGRRTGPHLTPARPPVRRPTAHRPAAAGPGGRRPHAAPDAHRVTRARRRTEQRLADTARPAPRPDEADRRLADADDRTPTRTAWSTGVVTDPVGTVSGVRHRTRSAR